MSTFRRRITKHSLRDDNYLSFTALLDNSTISIQYITELVLIGNKYLDDLLYSKDLITWTTFNRLTTITLNKYNTVYFKGNLGKTYNLKHNDPEYENLVLVGELNFLMTGVIEAHGNIMSITYNQELVPEVFKGLFGNCTSLVTAPELPSTTLAEGCYDSMFALTSLKKCPKLPATQLLNSCYKKMFLGCMIITEIPELPAITLVDDCYNSMFSNCTGLTVIPRLPAETLAIGCYNSMFYYCTGLTTVTELPAIVLENKCYHRMFDGCSSLNYVKAYFTTDPLLNNTYPYTWNWLSGVSATGTFVKNSTATWNVEGADGIPSGWTILTNNL